MLDSLMIPQLILKTLVLSFRHVEINEMWLMIQSLHTVPYLQPSTYACLASRWAAHRRQASPAALCPESMPRTNPIFDPEKIWSPHLVLPAGHTYIYIYKYYTLYVWYDRLYIMNINIFYNYAWEQIQVYDVSVYVSLCHPLKSLINVNWSTVSWCSTKAEVVGFLRSQCHFPYGQRTAYTGTAECEAKTIPSAKNPKIMKIHAWCISHTSHQAFHSIDQSFWCRMSFKSTGPP